MKKGCDRDDGDERLEGDEPPMSVAQGRCGRALGGVGRAEFSEVENEKLH